MGAFVATTDTASARAFYEGVLGLTVLHDDGFACVVDAHGTTVRILFDDGHDTGLFSWDYLYELGREQQTKWAAYIAAVRGRRA